MHTRAIHLVQAISPGNATALVLDYLADCALNLGARLDTLRKPKPNADGSTSTSEVSSARSSLPAIVKGRLARGRAVPTCMLCLLLLGCPRPCSPP